MKIRKVALPLLLVAAWSGAAGSQDLTPIEVSVTTLGKGEMGTVVGLTVQIAPEDRAVVGDRLRIRATLSSAEALIDTLSAVVAVDAEGTAAVNRAWPPGRYSLTVTVVSASGRFAGQWSSEVKIPPTDIPFNPPTTAELPSVVSAPATDALHFISPPNREALAAFDAQVEVPAGTAMVEFYLDSKLVKRCKHPPWSVPVPTSTIVKRSELRAIAMDREGRYLGEDAIAINSLAGSTGLEILPAPESAESHGMRQVTVAVSDRRDFRQLSLSLDDTVIARWEACPCIAEVPITDLAGAAVLTAELIDADGVRSVEVRTTESGFGSAVWVDLVEIQVQVADSHRVPVVGLETSDFSIFEDGREIEIDGVGTIADQPLSLVIAVDSSSSMLKSFPAVRQAVTAFSEDVLTARDRASVIRFSSGTEVLVSWSNSPEDIRQSLADVQPMRTTSLNDAVIRALLEIHGRRGRKALVLLTDGEDTSSHSTFSDTAWFAHSMRIPIFSITLRNRDAHRMPKFTDEASVRYRHLLSTLTRETGGKAYFRVTIEKLPEVYAEISDILRAQYVVWFRPQSTKDPDSFRSIEVKLSDPKLKVHTISGYYPSR